MSATAWVCIAIVIVAGMILNELDERRKAKASAQAARHPDTLYTADVVELAVRGALLTVDTNEERAKIVAELTVDELGEGKVFDGRGWRELTG